MNTKEYFIFIVLFTIVYIIFFVIYDYITKKMTKGKLKKDSLARININDYYVFSDFYKITKSAVTLDTIKSIYDYILINDPKKISEISSSFNIDNYETLVIYLYLEYISLLQRKAFDITNDLIVSLNRSEEMLVNKYLYYFCSKSSYQDIVKMFGNTIADDLEYLNSKYLLPGIIFSNSMLYYVGDYNEER
ncbi:MAG: hypothetical protein IJI22_02715 [Bacilli bacterium]|nr:hypothetical protein [Bacilli bacterium]